MITPPVAPPTAGDADATIRAVLTRVRRIAVLGASDNPDRPVHAVMAALTAHGYTLVPVNPAKAGLTMHGAVVVPSLAAIEDGVDMVDVFRASDALPGIVDAILALPWRPEVLWLQLGVTHADAEDRARAAGLTVIANRCPKIEIARLGLPPLETSPRP